MTERERIEGEIISLKAKLDSSASRVGDWAVIKCYEAKLQDKEPPYDVDALVAERQAIRDRINELQAQLEALPEDGQLA